MKSFSDTLSEISNRSLNEETRNLFNESSSKAGDRMTSFILKENVFKK